MARVRLTLPETFRFTTTLPVRISDINYGGHLGNDAALAVLHEARLRFLKHFGLNEMDVGDGLGIIMADTAIVYKAESFYGDTLSIDVDAVDPSSSGCDIVYRVREKDKGHEIIRAKTGIVFYDYDKGRPRRMPEIFRRTFSL